jgi:hypothetical protein
MDEEGRAAGSHKGELRRFERLVPLFIGLLLAALVAVAIVVAGRL